MGDPINIDDAIEERRREALEQPFMNARWIQLDVEVSILEQVRDGEIVTDDKLEVTRLEAALHAAELRAERMVRWLEQTSATSMRATG